MAEPHAVSWALRDAALWLRSFVQRLHCRYCARPLPRTSPRNRKWCGSSCRNGGNRQRRRAERAAVAAVPQVSRGPAFCGHCGTELPDDGTDRQYCKPSHKTKAKLKRHNEGVAVERAWALNSPVEAHAVSCDRKRAYGNFGEALTALRWLREDTGAETGRAYKCLACPSWHITTSEGREDAGRYRAQVTSNGHGS